MGSANPGGFSNQGGAPPPQGGHQPPPGTSAGGLDDNVASALCYMPFLLGLVASIVFLLIEPYNRNTLVRFHAFQSIFLAVALVVLGITLAIVGAIVALIPVVGWIGSILGFLLSLLVWAGSLVLYLFLMYKSYNNQRIVLPVVGVQAEKQAQK